MAATSCYRDLASGRTTRDRKAPRPRSMLSCLLRARPQRRRRHRLPDRLKGRGDVEPEPVVLGGLTLCGAIVTGGGLLFAVFLLWFTPAITIIAITATTAAIPAIQIHGPPPAPSTGPLSRGRYYADHSWLSSSQLAGILANTSRTIARSPALPPMVAAYLFFSLSVSSRDDQPMLPL